jgi:thymidylate synthase
MHVFAQATLDDLLHDTFSAVLRDGVEVKASRGNTLELSAVVLELSNPLARLSRSESRGVVFSGLGELCWYLQGDDSLAMIEYYVPAYREEAVGDVIMGAYGPRLFRPPGNSQFDTVLKLLRERPQTRRAVLQVFDAADLRRTSGDVPCTCTLQFMTRSDALDLVVYMRSNDAVKGLAHDIFCFTMIQELVAKAIGVPIGRYFHMVGSLHIYKKEEDLGKARAFLDEGFQTTKSPMPPISDSDPFESLKVFLQAEASIRVSGNVPPETEQMPEYWRDLTALLEAFRAYKVSDQRGLDLSTTRFAGTSYEPFVGLLVARHAERAASR